MAYAVQARVQCVLKGDDTVFQRFRSPSLCRCVEAVASKMVYSAPWPPEFGGVSVGKHWLLGWGG